MGRRQRRGVERRVGGRQKELLEVEGTQPLRRAQPKLGEEARQLVVLGLARILRRRRRRRRAAAFALGSSSQLHLAPEVGEGAVGELGVSLPARVGGMVHDRVRAVLVAVAHPPAVPRAAAAPVGLHRLVDVEAVRQPAAGRAEPRLGDALLGVEGGEDLLHRVGDVG